jgi:dTDP-4-amino-4,6-dideoxygalactose transaminase
MADWIVPLSDVRLTEDAVLAVADVLRSGWLSQGPRVAAFETAFAEMQGGVHAVAVASGTAALHLICAGLGFGPGDEVILPSLTFAATAAAVAQTGATPVFAEIAAVTRPWLSTAAVRAAITPRTVAILTVAYGGHPGELWELASLAAECGLVLIEDAAHASGASVVVPAPQAGTVGAVSPEVAGLGTVGTAAAFSFFANKNLPLGEGGLVLTADAPLAERMRRLRSHGLSAGTWQRHGTGAAEYEVLEPGFNYRLDETRAALGLALLPGLARENRARAALAARYAAALAPLARVEPVLRDEPGLTSAWHIYPVLLAPEVDRTVLRRRLAAAGIQTSIHYPPLHRSPAFGDPASPVLAATEAHAARTVTLPMFGHMTELQQDCVVAALIEALDG